MSLKQRISYGVLTSVSVGLFLVGGWFMAAPALAMH